MGVKELMKNLVSKSSKEWVLLIFYFNPLLFFLLNPRVLFLLPFEYRVLVIALFSALTAKQLVVAERYYDGVDR